MNTKGQYYDLARLSKETGLSTTVIKSLIVDYNIPCVQIGLGKNRNILVDYEKFVKIFDCVNVSLRLRTLERRRKNNIKCSKWYKEHIEGEIEKAKKRNNEKYNTFGREGHKRGNSGMCKRDYDLTDEQLKRRIRKNESRGERKKGYGILIAYEKSLDDVSVEEYAKKMRKAYNEQYHCAIHGTHKKDVFEMSKDFLFDFDLEMMYENKCKDKHKKKMERWWHGNIKSWTVKDGIWKDE